MSTSVQAPGPKSKQHEPVIPVEEVKKEDTKGDKKGHGKTHKGPNSVPEKTDRSNQTGQRRNNQNGKKSDGAYVKKIAAEGDVPTEEPVDGDTKEEKKVHKPKYERPERISAFSWDKFSITLETPIPVKPTEKERLVEPKKEDLEKKIDAISKKIESLKLNKKAKVVDILSKDKTTVVAAKEQADPLHTQLKELNEIIKVLSPIVEAVQAEVKVKQDILASIKKREDELAGKMKTVLYEDQIRAKLEELTFTQENEKLTGQEEKRIVNQIEELKLSLPFAIPLNKVRNERKELESSLKEIRQKSGDSYKKLKEARTKAKGIREELDRLKKLKEETNATSHPEIDTINEAFVAQLDALKKERNELRDKHHDSIRAYHDQQELFRYIDFVKRQHEFLRKREQQKKRDEDRKKREEEDLALDEQKKKSKYVVFVETADLLINYLEKLSGKGDKKDFLEVGEVEKPAVTQTNIKPEDLDKLLQKEKLTVLVSKKDRADQNVFGNGGTNKKGKQATQQKQQPKVTEKPAVDTGYMHSYEIMQQFEKLAVNAPTYSHEIEKIIALVNEKKQYYIDLPNKEASTESGATGTAEGQEKKGKNSKHARIEFDESAFPTIGN